MTITILEDQLAFYIAIDTPNILDDARLEVFSPYSNTVIFDKLAILIESNARYSRFLVDTPTDLWDKHVNGMYTYRVYYLDNTYDTGSFKLITQPGGDMGTIPHISNNENRQATVVYRANY